MNFSNLSEDFDKIKDGVTDEFKTLESNVADGKMNPMDALKEGEENAVNRVKGFFGSSDKTEESNGAGETEENDSPEESKEDAGDDKGE